MESTCNKQFILILSFYSNSTQNIDGKRVDGKGLVVYSINPKTGSLDNKAYFNLNVRKGLSGRILNFVTFLNGMF